MIYVDLLLKSKRHWLFFTKSKALAKEMEIKIKGGETTVSKIKGQWVVFQLN